MARLLPPVLSPSRAQLRAGLGVGACVLLGLTGCSSERPDLVEPPLVGENENAACLVDGAELSRITGVELTYQLAPAGLRSCTFAEYSPSGAVVTITLRDSPGAPSAGPGGYTPVPGSRGVVATGRGIGFLPRANGSVQVLVVLPEGPDGPDEKRVAVIGEIFQAIERDGGGVSSPDRSGTPSSGSAPTSTSPPATPSP